MDPGVHIEMSEPGRPTQRLRLEGQVELGREGRDITVNDPSVSRRHLLLEMTHRGIVATDLGSSNGTLVNDHPIGSPTPLRPGDEVAIGDTRIIVAESSVTLSTGGEECNTFEECSALSTLGADFDYVGPGGPYEISPRTGRPTAGYHRVGTVEDSGFALGIADQVIIRASDL